MKPTVLIIDNSVDITGAFNAALRSASLLSDRFDFCLVLPAGSGALNKANEQGISVYEMPMKEIRKDALAIFFYLPFLIVNTIRLFRLVRTCKADLIVSNDFYNLLGPTYKLFGGSLPYICYVRFRPSKFPPILVKLWCSLHHRLASSIIAVSEVVKNELSKVDKIVVIGGELPAVDHAFTKPTAELILYPSNYIDGKGHQFALQCFSEVHHQFPQWKLRFVGGDMGLDKNKWFKKGLIDRSAEMKLQNCVEWGGFSERMDQEYLGASIILNFSESESFSFTCVEAMFYGRPVVATKSGGPQEIVENEKSGLLVDVGDVQSMSRALVDLISKPEKRTAMGFEAYNQIRERFDRGRIRNQLISVYTGALKRE